jgi:hypothetical protein
MAIATLDVAYIRATVEEVLSKHFPAGSEKRRVIMKEKGIEMACPICGDSQKNPRAKRGILFFHSLQYACQNEGCRSSLTGLCKDNHIQLDPEQRMAIFQYLDQQILSGAYARASGDQFVMDSLDKLMTMEQLQAYFDEGDGFLRRFRPITKRDPQHKYLVERGTPEHAIPEIYAAHAQITPSWKEEVIVLINRSPGGKVLGMQTRNLQGGLKRRFKIYNFEFLYNELHPDAHIDPIDAAPYNKLSYLFNILRVDFERPVTVFEGYLDALFYPNAIGAVGTETDFGFLTSEGVDVRFFFDNDGAGHWKAQKYLRKGFPVFLWEKLFARQLARAKGDPLENARALRMIKDLNALANATPGHDPYHTYGLEAYFSAKDGLDSHWIPAPSRADKAAYIARKSNKLPQDASLDALAAELQNLSW